MVECTQGAVLIAVQGGVTHHGIVSRGLFVIAPQLRAKVKFSNGALGWWSQSAHGVREPQKALVTAWVNYVCVAAALCEGAVICGTVLFLWGHWAPDHCVKFKGFLRLQHVCCFLMRNNPALQTQDVNRVNIFSF